MTSPGLCIGSELVLDVLLDTDMILQADMRRPVPHAETTLACKEAKRHRITKSALLPSAGASLHMCMTPHGPDAATFERAVASDGGAPEHLPRDTLAFMFEARPGPPVFPHCASRVCGVLCSCHDTLDEVQLSVHEASRACYFSFTIIQRPCRWGLAGIFRWEVRQVIADAS